MAEQNNLGLARRGRKMKYYPAIHCQLFDGATRQKKASPWALSLWMNLAAVKLHFFLAPKWGAQSHLVNLKVFFFDIFSFQHEPSTSSQFPKKKATPNEATLIPNSLRWFPNRSRWSWPLMLWRYRKYHLKTSHTKSSKSNIATNMYMMFQMLIFNLANLAWF